MIRRPPRSTLFPYTTALPIWAIACPSTSSCTAVDRDGHQVTFDPHSPASVGRRDRKSTRLNSSHVRNSYAVFCLKKKNTTQYLKSLITSTHSVAPSFVTTKKC